MSVNDTINYFNAVYNQVPPQVWQSLGAAVIAWFGTEGGKALTRTILKVEKLEHDRTSLLIFAIASVLVSIEEYVVYQSNLPRATWVVDIAAILTFGTVIFHIARKTLAWLDDNVLSKYQIVSKGGVDQGSASQLPGVEISPALVAAVNMPALEETPPPPTNPDAAPVKDFGI